MTRESTALRLHFAEGLLPEEEGLRAHVMRVAAVAARAAECSGLSPEDVHTIAEAGSLHHVDFGSSAATAVSPQTLRVLKLQRGDSRRASASVRECAAFVDSANAFDEMIEGLPYEDASTGEALHDLFTSGLLAPRFVEALHEMHAVSHRHLIGAVRGLPAVAMNDLESAHRFWQASGDAELWQHARDVSQAMEDVARRIPGRLPDWAVFAGLLHDLGRVAFQAAGAGETIGSWRAAGIPEVYAELLAAGVDHADIGAEILESWRLPREVADAIRRHHRPELTRCKVAALIYSVEDFEESLPSLARDHLAMKCLRTEDLPRARGAY